MPRRGPRYKTTPRGLKAAIARIERKANVRALEIAELIVQEIRLSPITPRLTHLLANSYKVVQDPADGKVYIRTDVRYWAFVEYGTGAGREDKQPHVTPAVDLVRAVYR